MKLRSIAPLLAFLCAASGAWAHDLVLRASMDGTYRISRDIDEAIQNIESWEQRMLGGSPAEKRAERRGILLAYGQMTGPFREKFKELGFAERLAPPEGWQPGPRRRSWPGQQAWLARLSAAPPPERCDLLELAYVFAVTTLARMEPSSPITASGPGRAVVEEKDEAFLRDERRAAWILRYVAAVPKSLFPENCHCHAAGYCLYEEASARWNFVFGPMFPIEGNEQPGQAPQYRRPIGFAELMCGRSMNAHYIDSEVYWDRPHDRYFRPSPWSPPR